MASKQEIRRGYGRKHYARHRERLREKSKMYHRKQRATLRGRLRLLFHAAKFRAKQKGLSFDIVQDDLIANAVCPVLGIPLRYNGQARSDDSASLDRRDNSKGYEKGNVDIISFRANALKSNATVDEIRRLLAYMELSELA